MFGVAGCGSDDDEAPVESRIKNSTGDDAYGSDVPQSNGEVNDDNNTTIDDLLYLYDCNERDSLDRLLRSDLRDLLDRLDRSGLYILDGNLLDDSIDLLNDRSLRVDLFDVRYHLDLIEGLDDRCAAELKSGNYAPEGDDVDGG